MGQPITRRFSFDGPGDTATAVVEGHPDAAISEARVLFGQVFYTYGAWHLTEISCLPPGEGDSDDGWVVTVTAELKIWPR